MSNRHKRFMAWGCRLYQAALLLVCTGVILVAAVQAGRAQGAPPVYDDLIIAVRTEKLKLADAVYALQSQQGTYVPLGTLADLLGIYIDIDTKQQYAHGYIGSKEKDFTLDVPERKMEGLSGSYSLAASEILSGEFAGDDLYVSLDVINKLWPLTATLDMGALTLNITPIQDLPVEASLERKARQEKLARRKQQEAEQSQKNYRFVATPYRAFSLPALDINMQAGYLAGSDEGSGTLNVTGVQDLAFASADYSVSVGQRGTVFDRPENIRFRLRRQNIHEGALPGDLQDVQAGDVRLANRERISSGQSGRGIIFTNKRQGFIDEFDLVTIEGIGPPGWEAELYLNNQLIDFGLVDARGEYRFEDISLGYGNNRLKTILYGPQGQVREEIEDYQFKSNMARQGETVYSGGIIQAGKDLIPLEERISAQAEGLSANLFMARGINHNLTLFASGNSLPQRNGVKDEHKQYLSAGAIASLFHTLIQAEAYQEIGGGQAMDLRTQNELKGVKVNTRLSFYHDFDSEEADFDERAKRFDIEGTIRKSFGSFLGTLGLELGGRHFARQDDTSQTQITTRQSLNAGGVYLTHITGTQLVDDRHVVSDAVLSASMRMMGWRLRGNIHYDIYPEGQISYVQGELRRGSLYDFSTAFTAGYDFNHDETMAGFQLTKDFDRFLGSAETNWSSDEGIGFMLRASTSIGPYDTDGSYLMTSQPLRNAGPVTARIYRDNDGDGFYTDGDEPVEHARLMMDQRTLPERSDAAGYLSEIAPAGGSDKNISLQTGSLSDPYLMPVFDGYRLHPRPGMAHHLDFPLIDTGAIDGTVRRGPDGQPVSGLELQLINKKGDVVKETQAARDGFFNFEYIRPGEYIIRPHPASGAQIEPITITIDKDNLFWFGSDLIIAEKD